MDKSYSRLFMVEASPRARRLLWHLFSIGSVILETPDKHASMEKPGAHLFWVLAGTGTLKVPGRSYALQPGTRCWLVDMTKPREYIPTPGQQLVYTSFRFGGPMLEAWREELGSGNEFNLTQPDFDFLIKREQNLLDVVQRRSAGYEWQVHELLTQMLGRLLKERGVFNAPVAELPRSLLHAVELVMADPSRDWKVTALARQVGVSDSCLRRMFREHQHESIHEFLQRSRLDCARRLLCDKRISIKEVAMKLEFSSEFYFSRFFKKRTGMSPREFRETGKQETPTGSAAKEWHKVEHRPAAQALGSSEAAPSEEVHRRD